MKILKLKRLTIFLFLIVLSACNSKKRELQEIVKLWQGRKFEFPMLKSKIRGCDTLWKEWRFQKYKLVHYIDATECTSCQLHLYDWSEFIKDAKETVPDLGIVFILALPDTKEFDELAKKNHFVWPILHDPLRHVDSLNKLPQNPQLKTFLLDSLDQIIILGNPVKNLAIKKMLISIIEGKK